MGSAVIFSGTKVKTLKSTIDLNGGNDIISSTVDPTTSPTSANPGSLLLNSSTGKLYRKNDSGSSTNWTEVGASGQAGINYILNPDAANGTTGWSTYKETDSVTFQDTGDTVTLNSHGIAAGTAISFTSITSTTGISTNTLYYVVNPTTNTFQVATSVGGSALALTTNGSGTMVRSIPKTGSGGSPNVTWTRDTTTPLRGSADFNFTKGAANYMGEGVAYSFTIDNADIAKPLTVTFDYELLSGTYTTGDLTVYLIADPSGTPVIIQPAGYQIQSATASTKMRHIATFQTQASGTSYRLVVQVATVSAFAYTFALDTIAVGPQYASYGCPVTDWQNYTPTGSWVTNVTYTGQWRRVGDSAEIHARVACSGAPTSATLTINLPSGLVIDTTKLTSNAAGFSVILGQSTINDSSTTGYKAYPVFESTTSVRLAYQNNASGTGTSVTQAAPFTFGTGDSAEVAFMVPIVGWSSNVVMSSDAATNVVAASGQGGGTAQRVNVNVTQNLNFGTIDFDTTGSVTKASGTLSITTGNWSGGNWKFTAPVAGYYEIDGCVTFTPSSSVTGYDFNLSIYKNGVSWFTQTVNSPDASGTNSRFPIVYLRRLIQLNAGDYIDLRAVTNLSSTTDATPMWINIQRLSGPAQIAATDTVACSYGDSSGTSYTNATETTVKYATKSFDTTNSYSTSTGVFTVPVSGVYSLSASFTTQGFTVAATSFGELRLYQNSTIVSATKLYAKTTSTISDSYCPSVVLIRCVAGDTLYAKFYNGLGGTVSGTTAAGYNQISISRVGN